VTDALNNQGNPSTGETLPSVEYWGPEDYQGVDFQDSPASHPVILKGYVNHWPLVQNAHRSPADLARFLLQFDTGKPLEAMIADPKEQGRLFYQEGQNVFNFTRMKGFLPDALEILASQSGVPRPAAFYVGSTPVTQHFPGLERHCALPGLDETVKPNIWLGNSVLVATHNDAADNIACVASGQRCFTLFPPDQEENLYITDNPATPGGRPISLVNLRNPDFGRFPKFREALKVAQVAQLAPGDALYMPRHWWHNVESFGPLNLLINFWWDSPRTCP